MPNTAIPTFRVRRSSWLRGSNPNLSASYLLAPQDERRCCLGFVAQACGISDDILRGTPGPLQTVEYADRHQVDVEDIQNMWPEPLRPRGDDDTPLAMALMAINDAEVGKPFRIHGSDGFHQVEVKSDNEREAWLSIIGSLGGIHLDFVD